MTFFLSVLVHTCLISLLLSSCHPLPLLTLSLISEDLSFSIPPFSSFSYLPPVLTSCTPPIHPSFLHNSIFHPSLVTLLFLFCPLLIPSAPYLPGRHVSRCSFIPSFIIFIHCSLLFTPNPYLPACRALPCCTYSTFSISDFFSLLLFCSCILFFALIHFASLHFILCLPSCLLILLPLPPLHT